MATLARTDRHVAAPWTPGIGFDWLMLAAANWLLGGLGWDGWAHGYGLPDSFWTVWHFAFYAGFGATALVLLGAVARRRASTDSWRAAIPAGYEYAVAGVVIFAMGGAFDMAWHLTFGIETSTDALLSPSHLVLGVGVALIVTGPLLAAWRRGTAGTLSAQLPAVLSLTALLGVFMFFNLFAGPYANLIGVGPRPNDTQLVRSLLGMYLFVALFTGCVLVALRRGTLPIGAMTVMLSLNAVGMILVRGHATPETQLTVALVAVAAGAAGDLLLWRLRPSLDRTRALRAFAFLVPAAYFAIYLAVVALRFGTGWTVHELTGMVALAGIAGLLMSFVFTEGSRPART